MAAWHALRSGHRTCRAQARRPRSKACCRCCRSSWICRRSVSTKR
jgi:hypothetical protein